MIQEESFFSNPSVLIFLNIALLSWAISLFVRIQYKLNLKKLLYSFLMITGLVVSFVIIFTITGDIIVGAAKETYSFIIGAYCMGGVYAIYNTFWALWVDKKK